MLKSLRIALCGETTDTVDTQTTTSPEEKTITMSGPLSEVFTKALQIVFAKKDMVTEATQIHDAGLESQANDAIMAMSVLSKQKGLARNIPGGQYGGGIIKANVNQNSGVYAIPISMVTQDTIPSTASAMIGNNFDRDAKYLVLDNSGIPVPTENLTLQSSEIVSPSNQYTALENQCKEFGITLVVGFENLVKILKQKG